jgi:hypothetical protein
MVQVPGSRLQALSSKLQACMHACMHADAIDTTVHLLPGDVQFHVPPDIVGEKSLPSICVIMMHLLRLLQNVYNAFVCTLRDAIELFLCRFNA